MSNLPKTHHRMNAHARHLEKALVTLLWVIRFRWTSPSVIDALLGANKALILNIFWNLDFLKPESARDRAFAAHAYPCVLPPLWDALCQHKAPDLHPSHPAIRPLGNFPHHRPGAASMP